MTASNKRLAKPKEEMTIMIDNFHPEQMCPQQQQQLAGANDSSHNELSEMQKCVVFTFLIV